MSNEPLSRIPFTMREELMISSMAKWMRFMGVVMIIAGALGLLAVAFITMSGFNSWGALAKKIPYFTAGQAAQLALLFVAILAVVMCLALWQGQLLYRASDFFELVAKTDDADQEYVFEGFACLKTFFIIEGVFMILQVVMQGLKLMVGKIG